jgi:hypothetical protein
VSNPVMNELEGWTLDTRPQWQDRRAARSEDRGVAMQMQLDYVRDALELDAMVLADDLGMPVVASGDRQLAERLAEAALWTGPDDEALDPMTLEQIRSDYPWVRDNAVAWQFVDVPGVSGLCRLVATGSSTVRFVGIQHASAGLQRIGHTCH